MSIQTEFDLERYQRENATHRRSEAAIPETDADEVSTRCGKWVRSTWVLSEAAAEFVTCPECK